MMKCLAGQYITQLPSEYRDYQCNNCSMCPAGKYRNLLDHCSGSNVFNLDPANPDHCKTCGSCPRGFYRNLSACDGTGSSAPSDMSTYCIKCADCPDMHNIAEDSECTGSSFSNTRRCILCTNPCGLGADNVYIPSDDIEVGCDGKTLSSTSMTLKPCRQCATSCPAGQIRVSGCNGTTRNPFPVCSNCSSCGSPGQYITQTCQGGSSLNVTCAPCTRQCSTGFFFAAQCTGNSTTQVCFFLLPVIFAKT